MSNPLSHWIASLLEILSHGLGARVEHDRHVEPVANAAMARVRRALGRLSALLALFREGRLSTPRRGTREPREEDTRANAAPSAAAGRRSAQLPSGRCWLLRLAGEHGEACAMVVSQMVAEPEMAALLAASPQAGRLLRPLWHMLCPEPMPEALLPQTPPSASARREVPIAACRGARLDAVLARSLGGPPTSTRPPDTVGRVGRARWA